MEIIVIIKLRKQFNDNYSNKEIVKIDDNDDNNGNDKKMMKKLQKSSNFAK